MGLTEIKAGVLACVDFVETLLSPSNQGEASRETGLLPQGLAESVSLTAFPPATQSGGLVLACC